MAIKPIPLIILLVVCCLAVSALATTNKNLDTMVIKLGIILFKLHLKIAFI